MSAVTDHLARKGIPFETLAHDKAYTSVDEARALGVGADEVLKTVVLDTASGHALVVVPGARRLDMKRVQEAVGDRRAHLATEEELERDFPGVELGAFPPLGSMFGLPTYVDPEVMEHETVVFPAGTQTESVRVRREDLFRDEAITVAPLTKHPEEAV